YAVSFYTLLIDREVVPTMPVILWSVWFLYALWLFAKRKQKGAWPILGILLGLIWHLNFALVLVIPLIFVAFLMGQKEEKAKKWALDIRSLVLGISLTFLFSIPLIAFEARHNFQ